MFALSIFVYVCVVKPLVYVVVAVVLLTGID